MSAPGSRKVSVGVVVAGHAVMADLWTAPLQPDRKSPARGGQKLEPLAGAGPPPVAVGLMS